MEKYKEYCDIHNFLEIFLQKTKLSEEEVINSVFYDIKDFIENIISRYELDSDSSLSKKKIRNTQRDLRRKRDIKRNN